VEDHVVPDRDIVADHERVGIMRHMQHAEVLDVGPMTDPDVIDVASDDCVEPGATVLSHDDVADDHSGLFDKARVWDSGLDALECADHGDDLRIGNSEIARGRV
jgi:hypothetical protein